MPRCRSHHPLSGRQQQLREQLNLKSCRPTEGGAWDREREEASADVDATMHESLQRPTHKSHLQVR